ncbi:MAG: helix-turn-helix transcriptional regulator [Candidatus Cloacimonetes bacterium]|nr:helix-turn-helix transcriptional regulator [Candidatus Cloacimonadota bacterium]
MKKNLKDLSEEIKEFEDFFEKKPDSGEKAWGLIHDFYNDILSYMESNNIKKSDLAAKLNVSRPAVSKIFSETPNISVKRMVEIADAVGMEIKIHCEPMEKEEIEVVSLFKGTFAGNRM